jgi:excisionase family DNA binding protein
LGTGALPSDTGVTSPQQTMTVAEAAAMLGISVRTTWRRIRSGELQAVTLRIEGQPGRGHTVVTLMSVQRAIACAPPATPYEPVAAAPLVQRAHPAPSAPPPAAAPAPAVDQLTTSVQRLYAKLAALESERRRLHEELAAVGIRQPATNGRPDHAAPGPAAAARPTLDLVARLRRLLFGVP